jgi:outer membrane protein insertion porin family
MKIIKYIQALAFFLVQPCSAVLISAITTQGNQRVDRQTLLDCFEKKMGSNCSQEDLDQYLKKLFQTGLFSDVAVKIRGNTLCVTVVEHPCLNQVAFEGNKAISDETFKKPIRLNPREICTPARIQESVQVLQAMYRAKGMYSARIQPKIIKLDFNRVDLVFEIEEGPPSEIESITFVGNKSFDRSDLHKVLSSKEASFFRFFTPEEERYDPERVRFDAELLRQHYLNNGFADFQLISSSAQISEDQTKFFLSFSVDEGKQYKFGALTISSRAPGVSVKGLCGKIKYKKGDVFNAGALTKTCDKLARALHHRGFPFVEVIPEAKKDEKSGVISVDFVIQPTEAEYVQKIILKGNVSTNDNVILRELTFSDGDPINQAEMSYSQESLENLGIFESVDISALESPLSSAKAVQVLIKEKHATSDIRTSGGYSSVDGPIGNIAYTENNFLGRGEVLGATVFFSRRGYDFDLRHVRPYFMDCPISFSTNVFYQGYRGDTRGTFKKGGYREQSWGLGLGANYALRKNLYQGWSYKIRRDQLHLRHDTKSSIYLIENLKDHKELWVSSVAHDIAYDRVKKLSQEPVGGYFARFSTEFTGLGGGVHCLTNSVMVGSYHAFDDEKRVVLKLDARYSVISKLGYMRFSDQSYLGGNSFPGFSQAGLGPRDLKTNDALGGRQFYTASAKLFFPIGLPREIPVKGVLFAQTGSLWNPIFRGPNIGSVGFQNRAMVGGGFIWHAPMFGKIGIIFTKTIQRQYFDKREPIMIILGQEF